MIINLIDGTYELFRHFYGLRRFTKGKDRPYGAVVGVLQTVLQMIDHVKGSASRGQSVEGLNSHGQGDAYIGVATDHVIESFRNRLWADYKTGAGIEPALLAQFHPLEEALAAMGVVVWPMIELEADDALASAAHLAGACMGSLDTCLTNDWRARELLRNLRLDPNDPFRLVSSPGCALQSFPFASRRALVALLQIYARTLRGPDSNGIPPLQTNECLTIHARRDSM